MDKDTQREHRVEAVSDGCGGYRWQCGRCGALGPTVDDFSATDAGAIAHSLAVADAERAELRAKVTRVERTLHVWQVGPWNASTRDLINQIQWAIGD